MTETETVRAEWVRRLRSGDYPQTRGALRRTTKGQYDSDVSPVGYCCLGVLCDFAVGSGIIEQEDGDDRIYYDGEGTYLPSPVMAWAGVTKTEESTMSILNDDGATFPEIADLLEGKVTLNELAQRIGERGR